MSAAVAIDDINVSAFTIPTESPEADGTYEWNATTLVLVEASAAQTSGIGFTYADAATAKLIRDSLGQVVTGMNAMDISHAWRTMVQSIRNLGRPGISSMAIAAVDMALWDLKARLLDLPLVKLFGQVRESVPIYGSGGFTNYAIEKLQEQLRRWVDQSIPRVKMKIGRDAKADRARVVRAREAIGPEAQLFVDANGAYSRNQALEQADAFAESGVAWFEEPVLSDDLEGLRSIRDRAPVGMEIAAGEYGYHLDYFRRMIETGAVDVLQADATRCGGFTGFLEAATLCDAHHIPLSAHCAPALHVHIGCATPALRHVEYFHDHARIENMLFDGVVQPVNGALHPDLSRSGHGLSLKNANSEKFKIR